MKYRSLVRPMTVLLLMLVASVLGIVAVPNKKLSDTRAGFDLEMVVPKTFGDWTVDSSLVPLPLSPDQEQALRIAYDQILSRTYVNNKHERIMLSIAYGSTQVQGLRAHRQEVCYSAQGFQVTGLEHRPLTVAGVQLPSTRMMATQGSRAETVTYWFTMGDQVLQTYFEREIVHLKYTLTGVIPDGYLVRVSSLSADRESAYSKHIEFLEAMLAHVNGDFRNRLIGRVGNGGVYARNPT